MTSHSCRTPQDVGEKFHFLFNVYPGIEFDTMLKDVGPEVLNGNFTYVTADEPAGGVCCCVCGWS
jgi:hypothetical protein